MVVAPLHIEKAGRQIIAIGVVIVSARLAWGSQYGLRESRENEAIGRQIKRKQVMTYSRAWPHMVMSGW